MYIGINKVWDFLPKNHANNYFFPPGLMDCPCLPPPALAVMCWTARQHQNLK